MIPVRFDERVFSLEQKNLVELLYPPYVCFGLAEPKNLPSVIWADIFLSNRGANPIRCYLQVFLEICTGCDFSSSSGSSCIKLNATSNVRRSVQ